LGFGQKLMVRDSQGRRRHARLLLGWCSLGGLGTNVPLLDRVGRQKLNVIIIGYRSLERETLGVRVVVCGLPTRRFRSHDGC
jgi:hypothetical protein